MKSCGKTADPVEKRACGNHNRPIELRKCKILYQVEKRLSSTGGSGNSAWKSITTLNNPTPLAPSGSLAAGAIESTG